MNRTFLLALAATLAVACSSGPEIKNVYCDPPRFQGFPSSGAEGIVFATASLDPSSESELGVELLEEGIIPVKLSLQLKGAGVNERIVQVEETRWDARLYLLDGTVLPWVDAEKVVKDLDLGKDEAKKVRNHAFRPQLIESQPLTGYLFFALYEKHFHVDGRKVTHVQNGLARNLRLEDSLLAFNLTQEDRVEPFYTGIRP